MLSSRDSALYDPLQQISLEDSSALPDEKHCNRYRLGRMIPSITTLSVLANIALGTLLVIMYQRQPSAAAQLVPHASYERGFGTDFKHATQAIETLEHVSSGALSYNSTTNLVERRSEPGAPQYFGKPSTEIDAAWYDLMQGEFFALDEQEAEIFLSNPTSATGNLTRVPMTDHYHAELAVFHSLHCVNAIRKALDEDYYRAKSEGEEDRSVFPANWHRVHIDHCLENVMQAIQCHGDLTPVPLYSWNGFRLALGVAGTHTCRNFSSIHQWLVQRNMDGSGLNGL